MLINQLRLLPRPLSMAWACCVLAGLLNAPSIFGDEVSFTQQIRPLLSDRCFSCHGFDEAHRAADLRLDQRDGAEEILSPGSPADSELLRRILSDDADEVMPPPDAHKPAFSPQDIELIREWIQQGAPYETHWAFVGPQQIQPPEIAVDRNVSDSDSLTNIDRFIIAAAQKSSMKLNHLATKRTLFRRLCLDLTGLPPTVNQLQQFLNNDSENAWEQAVDRLLHSPQYGEHMARYWLDLVRFSDTNGLHHDHYRDMTPYRDWVIDSFHQNRPFDQFVIDQVAGDLYEDPTTEQLIASGFNRLHLIIDVGTALPEESFNRNVVDRVTSVGTAFLGMTVQCASCHDHKYDPITQRDFYQLYAFFNNFDGTPETGRRGTSDFKRGLQPPYLNLPSEEQKTQLALLDAEIAQQEKQIREAESKLKAAQAEAKNRVTSGDSGADSQTTAADAVELAKKAVEKAASQLQQSKKARENLLMQIPAAMVMKERAEPRPAHVLIRGQYDAPGEMVERKTPSFLPPMKARAEMADRMDLARWLVDAGNPLTARVTVNRFWQQVFGTGLVRTSEDFGAQGEVPSHPELLDYLTNEFVESGWDVRKLMKSIVMSQTYQRSSAVNEQQFVADPANRLLTRGARYRLDAEVIRDQVFHVSGLLNLEMYGRSVKPPQPDGLWKLVAMPSSYPRVFQADTGDDIYRRSLYTFWKRALPPPQMTILDAPTRESCIARRERTNTPLQALLLMNEQQYFQAAMHLAETILASKTGSDVDRLRQAYEQITSQVPDPAAERRLVRGLNEFRSLYAADSDLTAEMMSHRIKPEIVPSSNAQKAELAAWTMVVHSLLNLDATRHHE